MQPTRRLSSGFGLLRSKRSCGRSSRGSANERAVDRRGTHLPGRGGGLSSEDAGGSGLSRTGHGQVALVGPMGARFARMVRACVCEADVRRGGTGLVAAVAKHAERREVASQRGAAMVFARLALLDGTEPVGLAVGTSDATHHRGTRSDAGGRRASSSAWRFQVACASGWRRARHGCLRPVTPCLRPCDRWSGLRRSDSESLPSVPSREPPGLLRPKPSRGSGRPGSSRLSPG